MSVRIDDKKNNIPQKVSLVYIEESKTDKSNSMKANFGILSKVRDLVSSIIAFFSNSLKANRGMDAVKGALQQIASLQQKDRQELVSELGKEIEKEMK